LCRGGRLPTIKAMRSTRWTTSVPAVASYALHDRAGQVLGTTGSHAEGVRMLQAYVLTAPGREDDVFLVSLSADGRQIAREDLFDIDFAGRG
jgi:hypothetical protein